MRDHAASGAAQDQNRPPTTKRLTEIALLFLRLGLIGFGGPAAHIAMMEEEVVARRRWLSREQFLDLIGATNLIPGPNSTEMAIHIGMVRAGLPGLVVAGLSFILPATAITLGLAWAYVRFRALPQTSTLLLGVKPVVVAIILCAVVRLGRTAVKTPGLAALGMVVLALGLLGVNEIVLLLGGGAAGILWAVLSRGSLKGNGLGLLGISGLIVACSLVAGVVGTGAAVTGGSPPPSLSDITLFFLKIGSVLFGSGYVLIAFLRGGLVVEHRWLTELQLLDAIAIGQFTPGPVLSTATFIGYLLAGWLGACVATVAIFLPSFLFVLASNPFIPRIRASPITGGFLDAVNVSAIGLMAAVTAEFALTALRGWAQLAIGLAAVVGLLKFRLNPAWLMVGGAAMGGALKALGGL
ncbi:MAG: chromate efflux transporter [candidate division NC10 bacterium]|nr:chromate efflux transporter [candidate division NC10 bacterium]